VILGLTHGTGHTANPCLAGQLAWARARGPAVGAYLVPSYPTPAQRSAAANGAYGACASSLPCRLHNDGAAQAADAVRVMANVGLDVPMVWVDVEYRHTHPWSGSHAHNRSVLTGVFRGLRDAGVRYGVYTTSYMWGHLTGGWTVQVPNWLPSGDGHPVDAKRMCRGSGTGGVTWLVQFTREWDEDLTCPVMNAIRGRPGPLWRFRHTTLSTGSSGPPVDALQRALGVSPTGTYDVPTTLTVTEYQRAHGLPVTASVDTDDWRSLGAFKRVGGHRFLLTRMTSS
jgi:hypothetical protein